MKTNEILLGIKILDSYTNDKYSISAEHDMIFFGSTTRIIPVEDVNKLIKLGWLQDYKGGEDFTFEYYGHKEPWYCYV